MSALGQKQTLGNVQPMSALPPKADIRFRDRHVRFVPEAEVAPAFRAKAHPRCRAASAKHFLNGT
jgi:hypothetical protein